MRWVILTVLVALLLWPPRSSAPNPSDAAIAAADALEAEFSEPYRILAAQMPARDDVARKRLAQLSGALFRVENAQLAALEKTAGQWHARLEADIVCALPTNSAELDLREAATFAMAYRTMCTATDPHILQHVVRDVIFAKSDGRWMAQLLPRD